MRAAAITGCDTSLVAPANKAAAAGSAGAASGSHAVVPPEQALQVPPAAPAALSLDHTPALTRRLRSGGYKHPPTTRSVQSL